jgi:hypothetical protein
VRGRTIIGVVAIAVATPAHVAHAATPNTFEGTCRLAGELRFAEPLGNDLRETTFTDDAAGTCSGTLNGAAIVDAPVVNHASGSGTLSCLAGHATTADTLTFNRRTRVRIVTDIAGGATQFAGRFDGAVSGTGAVEVDFLPHTDQATLTACQAGALRSARYELIAATITQVVG